MAWTLPKLAPRAFKPDLDEAVRHWEAYRAGDIIDRPILCVTAPHDGRTPLAGGNYHDRVFGDMDTVLDRALQNAEATYHGGESVPRLGLSFGCDELAAFCGGELCWHKDSGDTNWSRPFVDDWERALPLRIQPANALYQRMLKFYGRAYERVAGKMAIGYPDLHTNMDLLMAVRGSERLCLDLIDRPEVIERAMLSARALFAPYLDAVKAAGHLDEIGYAEVFYSPEGAGILQCDFSCMIAPAMFKRWVLPALNEEAEYVKWAFYHWDGPGALVHFDHLMTSRLHTFGYVPGDGHGPLLDHIELLQRVQKAGKAVQVGGPPEQIKAMHRKLRPEKVAYFTGAANVKDADKLIKWFVQNT